MYRIDDLDKVVALNSTCENIVADIKKLAKKCLIQTAGRRAAYAAPKLKEFGPVGALTQSGTTGSSEMAAMLTSNMA